MSDRLGMDGESVVGEDGESLLGDDHVEAMDVAVAPEPSVDDLLREFAAAELGDEPVDPIMSMPTMPTGDLAATEADPTGDDVGSAHWSDELPDSAPESLDSTEEPPTD
jgi:hypothetical protein